MKLKSLVKKTNSLLEPNNVIKIEELERAASASSIQRRTGRETEPPRRAAKEPDFKTFYPPEKFDDRLAVIANQLQ